MSVAGLYTPSACSLLTEGKEIEAPDPVARLFFFFQDPTPYPWRMVWSNVALGLEAPAHRDDRQRHDLGAPAAVPPKPGLEWRLRIGAIIAQTPPDRYAAISASANSLI